ncbi:hypothetical protein [Mitsuokella sp.]|uniref:hypothetical protein n=1 Tax=Mitsuokella sp. TaxID=2049034 RepID=UPI003D7E6B1D
MKNLVDVKELGPEIMQGIKRRHCQRYQRACQGCPFFVERESGLDCAAMIVEKALKDETGKEV